MESLLPLIIPALIPALSDVVRGVVLLLTGGSSAQPQNVDEAIRLKNAEAERLKALAMLDAPAGEVSRWVADLRASFRYLAAAFTLFFAGVAMFTPGMPPEYVEMSYWGAQSVWAFIFGDRMYAYIRRKG